MFYAKSQLHKGVQNLLNPNIVDLVNLCTERFLLNLPDEEFLKLKAIHEEPEVKYFNLNLKTNKNITYVHKNFSFNCINFNAPTDQGKEYLLFTESERIKLLRRQINSVTKEDNETTHFDALYENFSEYVKTSTCNLFYYKKDAHIKIHSHNWNEGAFHLLLHDIPDGSLEVMVGNETKHFTKKGEWFGFNTKTIHSAKMNGTFCKTISFLLPDYVNIIKENQQQS